MVTFQCKFFEMQFPDDEAREFLLKISETQRKSLDELIDRINWAKTDLERHQAIEWIQEAVATGLANKLSDRPEKLDFLFIAHLEILRLELVALEDSKKPNNVTRIY